MLLKSVGTLVRNVIDPKTCPSLGRPTVRQNPQREKNKFLEEFFGLLLKKMFNSINFPGSVEKVKSIQSFSEPSLNDRITEVTLPELPICPPNRKLFLPFAPFDSLSKFPFPGCLALMGCDIGGKQIL